MDSSVGPAHGEQEMSVWNGHYACTCYHPLFVFNQFGDLERCALRPGNVHSADGWDDVLKPVVARYQGKVSRVYFRAGAAGIAFWSNSLQLSRIPCRLICSSSGTASDVCCLKLLSTEMPNLPCGATTGSKCAVGERVLKYPTSFVVGSLSKLKMP